MSERETAREVVQRWTGIQYNPALFPEGYLAGGDEWATLTGPHALKFGALIDLIAAALAARPSPFDQLGADRLADEVAVLVRRRIIDARSPAGDALLDYRSPPRTPRADRLAELEEQAARPSPAAKHAYTGDCPDDLRLDWRDPECPARIALGAARPSGTTGDREALRRVGDALDRLQHADWRCAGCGHDPDMMHTDAAISVQRAHLHLTGQVCSQYIDDTADGLTCGRCGQHLLAHPAPRPAPAPPGDTPEEGAAVSRLFNWPDLSGEPALRRAALEACQFCTHLGERAAASACESCILHALRAVRQRREGSRGD